MGRSMGHWHWQWRPSRAADRLPLLRWPRADRQAAALHSPAAPVHPSVTNKPSSSLYHRKYYLRCEFKKNKNLGERRCLPASADWWSTVQQSSWWPRRFERKPTERARSQQSSAFSCCLLLLLLLLCCWSCFYLLSPQAELITTNSKTEKKNYAIQFLTSS